MARVGAGRPKRIKCGGDTWRFRLMSFAKLNPGAEKLSPAQLRQRHFTVGEVTRNQKALDVWRNLAGGEMREVALHELAHLAVMQALGWDGVARKMEEKMIERITTKTTASLYRLLRDNPDLVRWMFFDPEE